MQSIKQLSPEEIMEKLQKTVESREVFNQLFDKNFLNYYNICKHLVIISIKHIKLLMTDEDFSIDGQELRIVQDNLTYLLHYVILEKYNQNTLNFLKDLTFVLFNWYNNLPNYKNQLIERNLSAIDVIINNNISMRDYLNVMRDSISLLKEYIKKDEQNKNLPLSQHIVKELLQEK